MILARPLQRSLSLLFLLIAATCFGDNRLAKESSPYLRLHAHNPVDWFPWGPGGTAEGQEGKQGHFSCQLAIPVVTGAT